MDPTRLIRALPVALRIHDESLRADVARDVESALGWQVVVDSPQLPARLTLTDQVEGCQGAVVVARTPSADLAAAAIRAGALDVVGWPCPPERLAGLVGPTHRTVEATLVVVRGSAHGVGTTTTAVVLAACLAWDGLQTWLVTGEEGRRCMGLSAASPVCDSGTVPGLHVAGHLRDVADRARSGQVAVVDAGVVSADGAGRTDVLIARPDARLLAACARTTPRLVVTVGAGGMHRDERQRACQDVVAVHLREQFRVARAGLQGRLPGALPGRVVHELRAGLGAAGLNARRAA